jgi:hypothetical protein
MGVFPQPIAAAEGRRARRPQAEYGRSAMGVFMLRWAQPLA